MLPDNDNLPYAYAANNRHGGWLLFASALFVTLSGVTANWLDYTEFSATELALPLMTSLTLVYLYNFITNAVHEAVVNAEADSNLDHIRTTAADAQDADDRKTMLTPGFFTEKFFPQVPN